MLQESSQADSDRTVSPASKPLTAAHMPDGLAIAYRPIHSLRPYERNARTHSKQQIRKIKDSIVAFGFVNPVLITADDMIIAGHGRIEAAKTPEDGARTYYLPGRSHT